MLRLPDDLGRPALVALLLLLGTIWGLTFSLAKIGAQGGIPPFGYGALMHGALAALLVLFATARGIRLPLERRVLAFALVAGVTNSAIPTSIMLVSVRHLPAGIVAVVVTLAPLMTYALSLAVGLERPIARRAIGTAIGLAGALLIVVPRASLPAPEMLPWLLFAMVMPAIYSASNVFVARARPDGLDSVAVAALVQTCTGGSMLIAALVTGQVFIPGPPLDAAQLAVAIHAVSGAFAQVMFFEIVRIAGPVVLSQVAYVVTLTGLFWGWLLFGERHSGWVWLATAVILAGVVLVTWPARRRDSG